MSEQLVRFGPDGLLIGVLTRPDVTRGDAPPRSIVVLLSNTGTNSRVGPFRLNVEMARAFARAGYPTLRFDRSGLGDSGRRDAPGTDHEHALLDTQDALTWLEQHTGVSQVALVAHCSGVDVVHATMRDDRRVCGAVCIDGYAYHTDGFRTRHARRVLDLERLRRHWRRHQHRARHPEFFADPPVDASVLFTRIMPTADEFRRDVRTIAARGARLMLVYTGGMGLQINAPEQVAEMLEDDTLLDGAVSVAWMPDADHLFTQPSMRRALEARVRVWLDTLSAPCCSREHGDPTMSISPSAR